MEHVHNSHGTPRNSAPLPYKPQKRESPDYAGLSFESWRETRDSNPGNAINVRRFSRPLCKIKRAGALRSLAFLYLQLPTKLQAAFCKGCGFGLGTVFAPPSATCRPNTIHQQPATRETNHMAAFGQKRSYDRRITYTKPPLGSTNSNYAESRKPGTAPDLRRHSKTFTLKRFKLSSRLTHRGSRIIRA